MLRKLLSSLTVAAAIAVSYTPDVMAAKMAYAAQTSNERGIKITVILQNIRNATNAWAFEVTLETHTQPLNDDLTRSATLIADGKRYLPLAWAGAPPGGHHRKGMLRFKAAGPQPRSMELQIRLTGDTSPRSFKWLLN